MYGGEVNDRLFGGANDDYIDGGEGDDHLWGGNWSGDNTSDIFVTLAGSGKDIVHDFETGHDQIDLSSYGLEFSELQGLMTGKGWATEIDLSGLTGGHGDDKLILK